MSIYIGSNRTVLEGENARKKLEQENDLKWLKGDAGVLQIDQARWQKAQEFELKTWMVDGRWTHEDNNNFHKKSFGDYAVLRGMTFNNGIELGCGPFTNIRQVAGVTNVEEIHLLDPLIVQYLKHPFCRYKGGRMWAWERRLTGVNWPRRKRVKIIESSIEDYKAETKFDLILLINVLEHCRSVEAVWQKVLEIAAPGAFLVFADKYYDGAHLSEVLKDRYDAGHPIKVDQSVIDDFLVKHWEVLYRQVVEKKGRAGRTSWDDHQAVYYIGRKKDNQ
jgi:SAM-dependent methyltransferase